MMMRHGVTVTVVVVMAIMATVVRAEYDPWSPVEIVNDSSSPVEIDNDSSSSVEIVNDSSSPVEIDNDSSVEIVNDSSSPVEAGNDTCSTLKVLSDCQSDEGPPKPVDGQVVYLRHPDKRGHWWYPRSVIYWVGHWHHPVRTITESKDNRAKWIWRDCRDGYVCLESGRYPHRYLADDKNWGPKYVYFSADPSHDDRVRVRPIYQEASSEIPLVKLAFKKFGTQSNLLAYLYIPPRCEGYRQVAEYINPGSRPYDYKYKFESGVTRSESRSFSKKVSVGIKAEVKKSIVSASASGSFSATWMHEYSTSATEKDTHELSFNVPPGKSITVWQKRAIYGMYEWRSGTFLSCEKNA